MFGIGFFKGQPAEYVIKYVNGRKVREGRGLSFYYLRFNTEIVAIPCSSTDAGFIFNELTSNFQAVTIQGQCTYRIKNPSNITDLLNFSINPRTRSYNSEDPDLLSQRITNVIQTETRGEIQKRSLEDTLKQSESIAQKVLERIREANLLESMGIEILSIYFVSAKPTPEVAKALEADYREKLLRKADEAIYARRGAAVLEERTIREKELETEIKLEKQREELIALKGNNDLTEAESRGKALELESDYKIKSMEKELEIYRTFDPRSILALGFKEMGQNAEKIGSLTITSEILAALLDGNAQKPN